jgi:hypothetical protein
MNRGISDGRIDEKVGQLSIPPDPVPELLIHVGLPKTGTSAIQRYMYLSREAYAQHGIYWAETYFDDEMSDRSWCHHMYSHKWGAWPDAPEFPVTPDEAWRALGESIHAKGGRHIISSERLAALLTKPIGEEVINFIKEMAGSARVRLIGYVRRQDYWIESHLRQLLKTKVYQKNIPFNFDIEEYFKYLPPESFFDRVFSKAVDLLGKENVIVRVYHRRVLVGGNSVLDFLHACSLPVLGNVEEHTPHRPENWREICSESYRHQFYYKFLQHENL